MNRRAMVNTTKDNTITQGTIFIDGLPRGRTQMYHYRRHVNGTRYTGPVNVR